MLIELGIPPTKIGKMLIQPGISWELNHQQRFHGISEQEESWFVMGCQFDGI